RDDARAGAEAAEAPSDAEHGGSEHELAVDVLARREMELHVEERRRASQDESMSDQVNRDRAHHHEREARIPAPEEVEKADDLRRLRHPGDREAHSEEHARSEGRSARPHDMDSTALWLVHSARPDIRGHRPSHLCRGPFRRDSPLWQHGLPSSGLIPVKNYTEVPGKGISGIIHNRKLYLGNTSILPNEVKSSHQNGVHIVIDNLYKGCFQIKQKWRVGLAELLSKLAEKFKLHVLSGDTDREYSTLKTLFPHHSKINFKRDPQQKLEYILQEQQKNEKVIMLGDGLNDAGALKQSDFGIAITDNINNFTPGCDAILTGKNIGLLTNFAALSRDGLKVVKISFAIAILYNCIGIYFAVQGTLYPLIAAVLMPISTITIISFTSIATHFYARKNKL
ncbi:MAG: HAD family hydrolase, partial [Pedobacter sp.]